MTLLVTIIQQKIKYMNDNSHSNIGVKEEIKSQKDKKIIKKTTPKNLNKKMQLILL